MYSKKTLNVTVCVEPTYLEDQSQPENDHFVWAYTIKIKNDGSEAVQLRSRHWKITDARGITQEVDGDGVVGEQPVLEPGGEFEYTSGAPLQTPGGIMMGHYLMEKTADGGHFTVDIPAFSLDSPYQYSVIH